MMLAAFPILTQLEDAMRWALIHIHSVIGSWAWSIVVLTIVVRLLLVPLTVRQIHSMQNLQAHAPEMKAIQQRYKGDRQRQNEELMKFYKENQINPAASCLPMLAQFPIFIALYQVLRHFERDFLTHGAAGVHWLGLVNITEPTKDSWGPLLLVVYAASQLTSSFFMSTTMQRSQRIMLLVLPIAFIPFILNFPAGLMVYWLTTNLWTTGQGLVTRRLMPKPAVPEKRSSRTPAKAETAPAASDRGDGGESAPKPAATGQPRRVKRKKRGGARR